MRIFKLQDTRGADVGGIVAPNEAEALRAGRLFYPDAASAVENSSHRDADARARTAAAASESDAHKSVLAESLSVFGVSEKAAKRAAGVTDSSLRTVEGVLAESLSIFGIKPETAKRAAEKRGPVQ